MTADLSIQKTRSVKEILLVALQYMTFNARNLVAGISVFALPFVFTASILSFAITEDRKSLDKLLFYKKALDKGPFVLFAIAYILYILGLCIFNLSINKNMLRNNSTAEEKGGFLNALRKDIKTDLQEFAISFVIVYVLYSLTMPGINYLSFGSASESALYSPSSLAFLSSFVESMIMFLPVLIIMSGCLYFCFSTLFVCYRDKLGVMESVKKVWPYTHHKPTKIISCNFLLIIMMFLSFNFIIFIFRSLEYKMYYLGIDPNFLFITGFLQTLSSGLIILYYNIAVVFLYGSVEDELDGHYIKSKIENI